MAALAPDAEAHLHDRPSIGIFMSSDPNRIDYVLKGKIGGPTFGSLRFESKGEMTLPGWAAGTGS